MNAKNNPIDQFFEIIGPFGALFVLYWAVIIVFWLLVAAVVVAAILGVAAIIIAGIVALYAAKSAKALVTERRAMLAIWYSIVAAGGLSGGVMLSSVTILASSPAATEFFGTTLITPAIGSVDKILPWLIALADDSVAFFIRLVPICYLANRIFVARQIRGFAWLGVIPPLAAMLIFSIAVHYDEIVALLQNPSREILTAIVERSIENLMQPFRLAALGFQNPDALLYLLKKEFVEAWPNLFKLARFYPTAFFLYGMAVAGRALTT